jgi:DNA-binding CsgD family transcriptional regulator
MLLGRGPEVATCWAVLDRAGPASAVVLCGDPGIGKTAMHRAVADGAAARSGWRVLSTTGLRSEVDVPLANLADLLDPAARTVVNQLPGVQADALRGALRLAPMPQRVDEALLVRATVNTIRALTDRRLLIAVDDEQWIDADTRRLLGTAAAWLTDRPVGWLVGVRSDRAGTGLPDVLAHELGDRCTRIDLAELTTPVVTRLVLERFPGDWPRGLVQRIVELAAGNPYTALELARETAAAGRQRTARVRLSTSLTDSLRARLDRLAPATLAAVQVCALTTRPTRPVLRAVIGAGHTDAAIDTAVDDAVEAGILTAPVGQALSFSHPLLREGAYASMSEPARRRTHRKLAEVVEDPDEVAGHLAAGADEPDEDVAGRVAEAAERAWHRGAPARAAELVEAAIALSPDQQEVEVWHWRMGLLECLAAAGEERRARMLAEEWAAVAPDEVRGELTFHRGVHASDFQQGQELMARAVDEVDDPAESAAFGIVLAGRAGGNLWQLTEGRAHAERAVADARLAGRPALLRRALGVLGDLAARAGDLDAGAILHEAVRLRSDAELPQFGEGPEKFLGFWHMRRGEPDQARQLLLPALAAAERHGLDELASEVRFYLAEVEWIAGRWTDAEIHVQEVVRYAGETNSLDDPQIRYLLALIASGRGDVDGCRTLAESAIRDSEQRGDISFAGATRAVLGLLELSLDDPAAAVHCLEPAVRLLTERGANEPNMGGRTDLIEGYAQVGRLDDAATLLHWVLQAAERLDHPQARVAGARADAILRLARGDPPGAVAAADHAVAAARTLSLPLELGRCLLTMGTAQRRARQRRAAAASLDEAVDLLAGMGAVCWANLATAQRARLTHASEETLTPTEQRIADLVVQGRTNAEIAAALMISTKTVEANLTRIYRKLGVRRRMDLTRRRDT